MNTKNVTDTFNNKEHIAVFGFAFPTSANSRISFPSVHVSRRSRLQSQNRSLSNLVRSFRNPRLFQTFPSSISVRLEAGHDCRLGSFGCAKQRGGHRRDGLERFPRHRLARCVRNQERKTPCLCCRMILDGDAPRQMASKVMVIGQGEEHIHTCPH